MGMALGKFITLEGIEGCGKSTQQSLLVSWLAEQGLTVIASKEPGATSIGKQIREILLHVDHHVMDPACETLLYLADRAQHHAEVVKPGLARGSWIVCDRYHDSTLAYQGAARGLARTDLDAMFQVATGSLKPDLTILLDMEPETGLARARQRNHATQLHETEGRFEAEALHFHTNVREGFLSLARSEPTRFIVVEADREPEAVAQTIRQEIQRRWGVGNDV